MKGIFYMSTLRPDLVVQTTVRAEKGHPEQQIVVSITAREAVNVFPVIVVSWRTVSYVILPSVQTEAPFPLWVNRDSTFFDPGCIRHPHVSTTVEKTRNLRVLVNRCAFWIQVHFKHLALFRDAAESEISACWCVCVCVNVCFHVLWQPLSQFSPSVKTLRAQSSLPPLLLSRGPACSLSDRSWR